MSGNINKLVYDLYKHIIRIEIISMMKKLLYLIVLLPSVGFAEEQIQISPALAEMMKVEPLDPKRLENNFYVGQMGLYLPQENYLDLVKKHIQKQDIIGLQFLNEYKINIFKQGDISPKFARIEELIPKDMKKKSVVLKPLNGVVILDLKEYTPCLQYLNANCIRQTLSISTEINQALQENQDLLKRFISLISNSMYNDTIFPNGMDIGSIELPSYQGMSKLYGLILSDAILNIAYSNNQAGIELLSIARKRIDLQYNENSMPLLIDVMITNQQAQFLDQTMNALLDSGLLTHEMHNPQIEKIFRPYPKTIGSMLQQSILVELNAIFKVNFYPYIKAFISLPISQQTMQKGSWLLMLNNHAKIISELNSINEQGNIFDVDLINSMIQKDNASITLEYLSPSMDDYIVRLYEQQNYHQLVYLKYLILRDDISIRDIPEFLNSMGDLAKNTITKERYHFNAETRVLSTPLPKEGKYIPHSVRQAQQDDPSIQNLEVTIPLDRNCLNQLAPQGVPYEGAFKYQSLCREQNSFKK
ncbi:hypothetical protein [Wohlfahrtiimonas populi]|uniref:hypothetical protein n=1 Tax=Wohlfahrtiimonas populi TaxID=1940240 RepID=UPI00098CFF23|nr:hypothetical protein [Wohlfahrtiimonas populi]